MNVHKIITFPPYYENCYIAWEPVSKEGYIIDPGGECDEICKYIDDHSITVHAILATHTHPDHIGAVSELKSRLSIPFWIGRNEQQLLDMLPQFNSFLHLPDTTVPVVDRELKHGEQLTMGGTQLTVIETPGHTPGGVSFYTDGTVFTGDTLFKTSVGRCDLPLGNQDQLIESIKTHLLTLPDDTIVYPGHYDETTIGIEKETNPFL